MVVTSWPRVIVKDGEAYQFEAERPGWLVYVSGEYQILVGREEAFELVPDDDWLEGWDHAVDAPS